MQLGYFLNYQLYIHQRWRNKLCPFCGPQNLFISPESLLTPPNHELFGGEYLFHRESVHMEEKVGVGWQGKDYIPLNDSN